MHPILNHVHDLTKVALAELRASRTAATEENVARTVRRVCSASICGIESRVVREVLRQKPLEASLRSRTAVNVLDLSEH